MEQSGTSQSGSGRSASRTQGPPEVDSAITSAARALCPPGRRVVELAPKGAPRWFARDGFRWFIPMETWRVRLSGSRIYPAFSARGRAYRTMLRAWITVGGALFTHHTKSKQGHDWPLRDLLLSDMPTLSTAAVSIGGAIPGGRKITVQLMDEHGKVLGYAKYADNPYTLASIANEARMLESIPENVGPQLIRFEPFLDGNLLVQTPVPGRMRVRMRIDAAQRRFYERLIQPGEFYAASEHPFIVSLYERSVEHRDVIESIVEDLEHREWSVAWMHGDLAPYNMRWSRAGCLAFDWEHGMVAGFPYLDAAAMLMQVARSRRLDARAAKRAVSAELADGLSAEYGKFAPAIASLAAVFMCVSWYPPREPDSLLWWLRELREA
jgi:hypothetical protein